MPQAQSIRSRLKQRCLMHYSNAIPTYLRASALARFCIVTIVQQVCGNSKVEIKFSATTQNLAIKTNCSSSDTRVGDVGAYWSKERGERGSKIALIEETPRVLRLMLRWRRRVLRLMLRWLIRVLQRMSLFGKSIFLFGDGLFCWISSFTPMSHFSYDIEKKRVLRFGESKFKVIKPAWW